MYQVNSTDIKFDDTENKIIALRIYNNPEDKGIYEKLEFLGDSIIEVSIRKYLLNKLPQENLAVIHEYKSNFVNNSFLAMLFDELEFYPLVSKNLNNISIKTKADIFEAWIGAVFLDHGMHVAESFYLNLIDSKFSKPEENYVSNLVAIIQKRIKDNSIKPFNLEDCKFDSDKKIFSLKMILPNQLSEEGMFFFGFGNNKTEAKKMAAKIALEYLNNKGIV